jgi:glycosyltransferase involved in cell wall biosynthesis
MKILMVSMRSLHFTRWANQLEGAGHEVYWFDIRDGGFPLGNSPWLKQIFGWKNRFQYPGYYYIKNKMPFLFRFLQFFNERSVDDEFDKVIKQIKPDAVHSFALYVSCTPILKVMENHKHIPWIYSSWGSDLFYFQNEPNFLRDIKSVLPRVNYMFSDCQRDYYIAKEYGFQGDFLGVFPGGGGFHLNELNPYLIPFEDRDIVLIKGFQGRSGRVIEVLKAIKEVVFALTNYRIFVFGADSSVFQFAEEIKLSEEQNVTIKGRLPHEEVLRLMGKSILYIGNSNSDGLPNTLLESICMGAFPIQSNPGGVTEEIIENNKNGLLINDCMDVSEIKSQILTALRNPEMVRTGIQYNLKAIKPTLEFDLIKSQVLAKYNAILQ